MLARQYVHLIRFSSIQKAAATCCTPLYSKPLILNNNINNTFRNYNDARWLSTTPVNTDRSNDPNKKGPLGSLKDFKITMTPEEKQKKQTEIAKQKAEEKPKGLFAKFKFYFKRYWYIALPVHTVCCAVWLGSLFLIVRSGIDVLALLKVLHMPEIVINKVQNVPEAAGELVVALILYKIVSPLRYATTVAGIKLTFSTLQRMGKLRSAKEVEYGVRSKYETYERAFRRLNERRMTNAAARQQKTPASSLHRKKSHTRES
uniref:DUF1279 domain-containing protein n=1 Tax=Panagrolaimus superbus TaxID=310955 RepID=A0A914YKB8_9BILA